MMSSRPVKGRHLHLLARLGIVAAVVLGILGTAELGMHILGFGKVMTFERDPRFGYAMRRSQVVSTYGDPIETNQLGLRGAPLVEPKPRGVVRVLFLGGSIPYGGARIFEGDLFCRLVETLTREGGSRVEAVNVSAPGWGPQNWTAWIEANGLLDADAVVMVIATGDRARPFATLESQALVEAAPWLRLRSLWLTLRAIRPPGPSTEETLTPNRSALERLKTRIGVTPLFVVFVPAAEPDPNPELWEPLERQFPRASDLRERFSPEDFLDAEQLSVAGHRVVAEAIYARLQPLLAELATANTASGF